MVPIGLHAPILMYRFHPCFQVVHYWLGPPCISFKMRTSAFTDSQ